MPVAERAKQFLPFSALKGLQEALEQKDAAADGTAAAGREPPVAQPSRTDGWERGHSAEDGSFFADDDSP